MELIFNIFIGIFFILYLAGSFSIDKGTVTGDVLGAGGFPVLLAVLGLFVLVFVIRDSLKNKTKAHIALFDIKSSSGKALVLSVTVLAVYLLIMDVIGFILSTLIFAFISTRAMGYSKLRTSLIFSVVLSVALVVIFGKVFFVPLPRGIEIFRELSYYLY